MEQEKLVFSKILDFTRNNKTITGALAAALLALGTVGYQYRDGVKITKRSDGNLETQEIIGRGGNPLNRKIQKSWTVGSNLDEDKKRQEIIDWRNKMEEETKERERNQNNNGINQAGL